MSNWPNQQALGGLEPKHADIYTSDAGAAGVTVVSAVAGKNIIVVGFWVWAQEEVDVDFYTGPADTGTRLKSCFPGDRGGAQVGFPGHQAMADFQTDVGEALTIKLGAAKTVSGTVHYVEG